MGEGTGFFWDGDTDWGFDVKMEVKKFSGKEEWRGWSQVGSVATGVCDLLAVGPDHVTSTQQT